MNICLNCHKTFKNKQPSRCTICNVTYCSERCRRLNYKIHVDSHANKLAIDNKAKKITDNPTKEFEAAVIIASICAYYDKIWYCFINVLPLNNNNDSKYIFKIVNDHTKINDTTVKLLESRSCENKINVVLYFTDSDTTGDRVTIVQYDIDQFEKDVCNNKSNLIQQLITSDYIKVYEKEGSIVVTTSDDGTDDQYFDITSLGIL